MSDIVKKDDDFIPNPKQVEFAEIYCDVTSYRKTYQEIADQIKVSRMQIYRWRSDKRFMEWLQAKIDKALDDSIGELILHGIREAKKPGGYQYWRTLLEMAGKYIPGLKIEGSLEPPKIQFIYNKNEPIKTKIEDPKKIEGGK